MRKPLYRRLWGTFMLALIFARELWLSSVAVVRFVFSRENAIVPGIVEVPVDLRTDLGVATVANLISLTPGTTSLHTSEDGKMIYVHCLNAASDPEVIAGIRENFEYWVREVEG